MANDTRSPTRPHVSGTALEPQSRCAKGVRENLEVYFKGEKTRKEYLIVDEGEIASPSYVAAFKWDRLTAKRRVV